MNRAAQPGWQGEIWLAEDHCLVTGRLGRTDSHQHYAHQLLIGLDADVEVCLDGRTYGGPRILIPSQQAHAILSESVQCITLFAEPLAFCVADLQCLGESANAVEQLAMRMRTWPRSALDPRLAKALGRVRAIGEKSLPAHELASVASLSISQLERLCTSQLRVSVRRLVLWQRLRMAVQQALAGANLTQAALAAGFADSAHLSRSMRRHFGLTPSEIVRDLRLGAPG
ncbi:AraC family transcriptional regulator [Pseudomonas sp. UBA5568]|uniref:AraC family transcriptional regulator n=1 Tax=Pseudomonas sp. UBA5568 TaxID=1947319 RepID=UPI002591D1DC|nr:AraC family transcriptional regulator [Pseudomonas sp. UBA5568]